MNSRTHRLETAKEHLSFSPAAGQVKSQRQHYSSVQLHLQQRNPQPGSGSTAHHSFRQRKEIRKSIWIRSKRAH